MEQVDSVKQVQKQKTKSNEIDNSKIEVTIKNPKVVKFFNNNKTLNIEDVIDWVVDLLNNILTDTTTLSPTISTQIFKSINNQNNEFMKLLNMMNTQSDNYKNEIISLKDICKLTNQNITNEISNIKKLLYFNNDILVNKLNETKNTYISEFKNSISTNEDKNLLSFIDKVEKQNDNLFNKFSLYINEVIPKSQSNLLENIMKDFKTEILILSSNLKTQDKDLTVERFTELMNDKYSILIDSIQSKIQTSITLSEQKLNMNIDKLKDISSENSIIQKNINNELTTYISRHNKSTYKGSQSEEMLSTVLEELFPTSEIIRSSTIPKSGDLILKRINASPILIENKDYTNSVPYDEITKFHRDIEHNNYCNGLFISESSIISGKHNFQIDFHNNAILIYIHKCDYDPIKINIAIQIIDSLSVKMNLFKNNNISLTKEMINEFNEDYQQFIEDKMRNIVLLREYYNKQLDQLNDMKLPSIEKFLSLHFANNKKDNHLCSYCNKYSSNNKKSVARHERFCKNKLPIITEVEKEKEEIKELKLINTESENSSDSLKKENKKSPKKNKDVVI
jgi:hypothetical protein